MIIPAVMIILSVGYTGNHTTAHHISFHNMAACQSAKKIIDGRGREKIGFRQSGTVTVRWLLATKRMWVSCHPSLIK